MDTKEQSSINQLTDTLEKKMFWILTLTTEVTIIASIVVSVFENISVVLTISLLMLFCLPVIIVAFCMGSGKYTAGYVVLILLINCAMIPLNFVLSGGFKSGAPVIQVVGLALCATCTTRKQRVSTVIVTAVFCCLTYAFAILCPQYIAKISEKVSVVDICGSALLFGILFFLLLSMIMKSQLEENRKNVRTSEKDNSVLRELMEKQMENAQKIRQINHDNQYVYQIIYKLIEQGEIEQAKHTIRQNLGYIEEFAKNKFCENDTLNNIFSYCQSQCEKKKIKCTIQAKVDEKMPIERIDLIAIVSNLVNNAIQGVGICDREGKHVSITANYDRRSFTMTITNSCKEHLRIVDGVLVCKAEGIKGVISVLNRYHGALHYEYLGDDLVCKVVINL